MQDDAHPALEPLQGSLPPLAVVENRSLEELVEDGDLGAYVRQQGLAFVAARLPKSRGRALYAIGEDLLALEWLLLEAGGVLSPGEEEEIIDRWFAELREERNAKLDDYAALIRDTSARVAARKAEEDRMARLRTADEGLARRLKERLLAFLEKTGETRIDTTHFRIRRQANGGKLALDWKVGEDRYRELPEPMREERVTYVPRQEEIRAALDAAVAARRERMEKIRGYMLAKPDEIGSHGGGLLVEAVARAREGWTEKDVRAYVPHASPEDLFDFLYNSGSDAEHYLNQLYPPSGAESILSFVDYKPRGQQVRVE